MQNDRNCKSTAGRSGMEELAEIVYEKVVKPGVYTWLPVMNKELCIEEYDGNGEFVGMITLLPERCVENGRVRYNVHRGNPDHVETTFNKPENAVRAFLTNMKKNYEDARAESQYHHKEFYEVEREGMCVYRIQTRFEDTHHDLSDSLSKYYHKSVVEDIVRLLLD